MDVTFQMVLIPQADRASSLQQADINEMYPADRFATLGADGNYQMAKKGRNNSVFLHVRGIPDSVSFNDLRAQMITPVFVDDELIHARRWLINPGGLTGFREEELLSNREITTTYEAVADLVTDKTGAETWRALFI